MDELIRFFHGGMVKENGEFENMIEHVELFDCSPSFKDLVDRVIAKHSCGIDEISLRGRFDYGKARAHYVILTLDIRIRDALEKIQGYSSACKCGLLGDGC